MSQALERLQHHVLPVAHAHADAVDTAGRFPTETFAALKAQRLMGALIPTAYGGEGLSLRQVAELCSALGQACGSSALVYAMHHIKVSSLVAHGPGSAWHEDFMRRVCAEQLLLGSATTEGGGIGGDLRSSICAVERHGSGADETFTLHKDATVISYGLQSDAILITARRDREAPASDQVMVVAEKHQYTLTHTGGWNTLGMRGTCSDGFALSVQAPARQIFPQPFAEIAAQSMLGYTHVLWASVWYGIATEAASRAHAMVKADTKRRGHVMGPGVYPTPGMARLAELTTAVQAMKGAILGGIDRLERALTQPHQLESVSFLADMNTLKVNTSQAVVDILNRCMLICGLPGYRNDSPYSLGRLLRDAHSAPVMISNDRILTNTANLSLMNRFNSQL
jgi:acyl-CoA dehydrogenase